MGWGVRLKSWQPVAPGIDFCLCWRGQLGCEVPAVGPSWDPPCAHSLPCDPSNAPCSCAPPTGCLASPAGTCSACSPPTWAYRAWRLLWAPLGRLIRWLQAPRASAPPVTGCACSGLPPWGLRFLVLGHQCTLAASHQLTPALLFPPTSTTGGTEAGQLLSCPPACLAGPGRLAAPCGSQCLC